MGQPQRYLFDVSFDQAEPGAAARFSSADMEAARVTGLAEGHEAAAASIEARVAATLEALKRGMDALEAARDACMREAEQRAIALLRTALQKTVPALCAVDPVAEIEALLAHCLAETPDEPRVVLRVGDALFDAVQERLATITEASGYAGKVVLLADPALQGGDSRVEWANGGAERDTRRIADEIDAVLARALTAPPCPSEENVDG